jgi:hypothetical protein
MQDIIGGWSAPERFDAFLDDWRAILARRVEEVVDRISLIEGIRGLILAGGIGRDAAWPLSDIDLLPIYAPGAVEPSALAIERIRSDLLPRWTAEGWWTGIDVGRLAFTSDEVAAALATDATQIPALLADDRWYHSIDKGYGGRAVYDPDGLAAPLAAWLTSHRFDRSVVDVRLARAGAELRQARRRLDMSLADGSPLSGVLALQDAVKWLRALLLERWGERDASLARIGTRFDRLAADRGLADIVRSLHHLADLDDASIERRMLVAPAWVHQRHDRSLRARRLTGEPVTPVEDARDVLRVSTQYELRSWAKLPFPAWLAVPDNVESLAERTNRLATIVHYIAQPRAHERNRD